MMWSIGSRRESESGAADVWLMTIVCEENIWRDSRIFVFLFAPFSFSSNENCNFQTNLLLWKDLFNDINIMSAVNCYNISIIFYRIQSSLCGVFKCGGVKGNWYSKQTSCLLNVRETFSPSIKDKTWNRLRKAKRKRLKGRKQKKRFFNLLLHVFFENEGNKCFCYDNLSCFIITYYRYRAKGKCK